MKNGPAGDEEGVGPLAHNGCEGRIDFATCVGIEDLDLQPDSARSRFDVSQRDFVFAALAGLTSTAIRAAVGTSSRRSSSRFATSSVPTKLIPVRLPPGRARLVTRPSPTGSSLTIKTIGIVVVAAFAANAVAGPWIVAITATRRTRFGRQRRQPIDFFLGPAVFDRYVLALDIAGLLQALAKCRADGP